MASYPRTPRVSVILPVHNGAATIREAVDSVLGQTLEELELIAVDADSSDATGAVLERIRDPRLQVLRAPAAGPAATRNRGIDRARAELVAFIDADDVWLPGKLEAQHEALLRWPEAAVAYCWTDYVDAAGRFVCPDRRPVYEGQVYERLLTHNFIDCGSNVLVRRKDLLAVGGFDETLPVLEDWDLSVRLAARAPFACVPQALVRYRQTPGSLTTQVGLMEASFRRLVDVTFAQAPTPLQRRKPRSKALFFEYLAGKATQGLPGRGDGLTALRLLAIAAWSRPANLLELRQRPWVVKAAAKALGAVALPAAAMRALASLQARPGRRRALVAAESTAPPGGSGRDA